MRVGRVNARWRVNEGGLLQHCGQCRTYVLTYFGCLVILSLGAMVKIQQTSRRQDVSDRLLWSVSQSQLPRRQIPTWLVCATGSCLSRHVHSPLAPDLDRWAEIHRYLTPSTKLLPFLINLLNTIQRTPPPFP